MSADEIKVLEEVKPKVYKVKGISETKLNVKKLLEKPNNLRCAVKMCDGSFHVVHSELQEVLQNNKQLAKNGFANDILQIFPKESRSTRFLVFHPDKSADAFLLGDVESAVKRFSSK